MELKSYGITQMNNVLSEIDKHVEEIAILGYTIIENVLSQEQLVQTRDKIDDIYNRIEKKEGREFLESISERYMLRCPLYYDSYFLGIAANRRILSIVEKILGSYFILHLQNAIINPPNDTHHQSSWHRDLPYQNFVISKPLALSALYCIDDFTPETGGTFVLPHTHHCEVVPSAEFLQKHQLTVNAPAGSVLLFDAMLLHRAGYNSSTKFRRAINNVYTVPIIKQQLNLPVMLGEQYSHDPFYHKFLGYASQVANSDTEWRSVRKNKLGK